MLKDHFSAAELAGFGLPGLPGSERNIRERAEREGWKHREVPARGRTGIRREYAVAALPPPARSALLERHLTTGSSADAATSLAAPALPAPRLVAAAGSLLPQRADDLTDQQRFERDARRAVLAAIRNLQAHSGCSQAAAMTTLLTTARSGRLDAALTAMLRAARDPRGRAGDGYPSIRTLKRWLAAGDLAPKIVALDLTVPPWAPALMSLYGQPQKPSLAACLDDLPAALPPGVAMPSYDAANRFIKKLGNVERQRGRRLSRDIKNLLPFVRRSSEGFAPDAIYTADGHCFDAEVQHPRHGKAFRPEITTVLSVPTRRCVGWSAGLAESTWAVMDALRHAAESASIPAIWYVDNGSGFKNVAMTAEVTGFVGRIGCTITHSLPYNSQARGIEERSHKSIWVRAAKKLPTYIGADMDAQAKQKVFKLTRADIRLTGTSKLLLEWERFLAFCQAEIDAYNDRPHRSLPKTRDPVTGKPRHMSPNEAWQQAIDEGWQPSPVTAAESADLFRPEVEATTIRGEIRLHGNLYFSRELTEFTGDKVRVGYDIHDASRVWVRDREGRLICIAEFEANKRAYFPESFVDQAQRRRTEQRERRLEQHLAEVREELDPPAQLEYRAPITVPMDIGAERIAIDVESARIDDSNVVALPSAEEGRPWFRNDPDQYRWLMRNPAQWNAADAAWLLDYTVSEDYAELAERYEVQGVAWGNDDAERAKAKQEGFEVAAG